jgi:hypothetical protein
LAERLSAGTLSQIFSFDIITSVAVRVVVMDRLFDRMYAQIVKIYGGEQLIGETRYSPAKCLGARPTKITGNPDEDHISTSYVERSNLTLRLMNRRFTRLTLGFSKKIENHVHALALYTFH